ncbi:bifunctional diaminohydroxyphosphoribosylaminopyrimidine deaminase/5-amino-6-(5-phosphoribosylamino)uracil reductase RibD [Treponema zioleckii]|uniref:bifunctional diaminohydroxyphosphoribosylaminopyrimidine deaminase/5-amino-6-(5-phosphoribosylamino)uracil reductase RibD n=1 Tax=Treponema zioleckii TaxID=331680 RepID=UPI001F5B9C30|nr:bifunctional diaminohydroxyphosphoribosylaminopyrimidine deaminase/5-amino-6-(5-phosphoribosylamino)uracil reductase RibD [Treponema zioleckii]
MKNELFYIKLNFMNDETLMRHAIALAQLGRGWTNPNPLVGAVIARDGKIIAQGYHHKCGDLHAERDALKNALENGTDVRGATIFVTLEPCCHVGRQPPCTQAIIESGIKKVVVGSRDPNALVNGKGVKILREAGIEVVTDFLRDECDELNPVFFHYIKTKMPYVIIKYAMTADGLTATSAGESKWITGEKARENVHKTRSEVMAVMTGIGTVLKDNPTLNVRLNDGKTRRQPMRVILDSECKLPLDSNLVKTAREIPVILFCKENSKSHNIIEENESKRDSLESNGVKVIPVPGTDGKLSLSAVLKKLGEMGIDSLLVESGGNLNASLLFDEGNGSPLVQELHVYIAPKIFGNDGKTIFSPVRGQGINLPADCVKFGQPKVEFFGEDILLKFTRGGK